MILPFSTKFPDGTPTYFMQKIWSSLIRDEICTVNQFWDCMISAFAPEKTHMHEVFPSTQAVWGAMPKIHTIREDKTDRWKPGAKIHMVIFNRSKNQFQFAPVLECKAVQTIRIWEAVAYEYYVKIDGNVLRSGEDVDELNRIARNDGFESIEKMIAWFKSNSNLPLDFKGKIIHWTNL